MLGNWLDRAIGYVSPQAGLRRVRARAAADLLARHYEAASSGRRTQGWRRSSSDANAAIGPSLARLRDVARDMVRNNPNAKGALRTITNHVVGWGIVAKPQPKNERAAELWQAWAGTKACDTEGRKNFYGLQKLIMRTVVESGEVLVRRRFRRPEDGLPIPLQLQVLDADHLDTLKTDIRLQGGGRIVHGVEYDVLGRRTAYWLFPEHPGSTVFASTSSMRVPAEAVLHVFLQERPGQVRGPSWFAPCLLRFKDHDEYEDATLMKQKIAACLAVITTDQDGSAQPLGAVDAADPLVDSIEPGMILQAAPGRQITVVEPPSVREYSDYTRTTLRSIATGLGVSYEELTGDYSAVNFSSARLARLAHWDRVEDWRWDMLIPQFCEPVWAWAMQAAAIMGADTAATAEWTAPPMPMIEPDKEGLAHMRNIRAGITTLAEVLRERGYDPEAVLEEIADVNKRLDELEIVLDSDPRKTTQAGNPVAAIKAATEPKQDDAPPPAAAPEEE